MTESDSKRGRRTLVLIVALFLAPVLAAVFLNSRWTDWQPEPSRNYGQLVQPVLSLTPVWGQPAQADPTVNPWQLIIPRAGRCEADCQAYLDRLTRVRRTLGRHENRLQLVLVSPASELPPDADVNLWSDPGGRLETYLQQSKLTYDGLFLVDPLGNLMMHFQPPVDISGLSRDLDRLISHSKFQ